MPRSADIARQHWHVRFVPQPDSSTAAKSHAIQSPRPRDKQCGRRSKAERLSGLEVDDQFKFGRLLDR